MALTNSSGQAQVKIKSLETRILKSLALKIRHPAAMAIFLSHCRLTFPNHLRALWLRYLKKPHPAGNPVQPAYKLRGPKQNKNLSTSRMWHHLRAPLEGS